MIWMVTAGMAIVLLSGAFWYCYFFHREKKLLDRLQDMLWQAEAGQLSRKEISEEKVSALEDGMKKFLDGSLLEKEHYRKQKQVIQTLISDISHQTLTPVSNLKLYAGLLCEEAAADSTLFAAADTIREQTEKLDFLIQSLVRLSRLETGIIGVHPRRERVDALLLAVCQEYEEKAAQKRIGLSFADTALEAVFDRKWTREALGNLVDNAVKYTGEGGTVKLCAHALSFFVRIDVTDTGAGIPQEDYTRIFSRFYRGAKAQDQAGTGIGLYLTRKIIRAQEGYVTVASVLNAGSTFSVFLPALWDR